MQYFMYKVKDDAGRTLYGLIEGQTKDDIKKRLRRPNLFFISARPYHLQKLFKSRVKFQTLIMFTNRLSSLIEAGIPILSAMDILWRQSEDQTIQLVVSYMKRQLEEGNKISTTMEYFPRIFPVVYRALIRVGETSGAMTPILRKLTEFLEYKAKIILRTKKATFYPSIVVVFSVLVILGMFMFVVPTFQKLLLKLDVDLPVLTKVILEISTKMRTWGFFITVVFGGMGLYMTLNYLRRNPRVAAKIDGMVLKIPYFGHIFLTISLSQYIRSLSILLEAGVPLIESLTVANSTTGNQKIAQELDGIKNDAEQGVSLYEGFKKIKDIPVMLIEMIGIGESTGMMSQILEKVNRHFDEEIEYNIDRFLTMLEPLLIIFVGFIVIITLLSIYLPVISIWDSLSGY